MEVENHRLFFFILNYLVFFLVYVFFCEKGLLGLYFQIRDDYENLQSADYAKNKTFCEDLSEGKFSFPIIHAIRKDPNDGRIFGILRQRTQDYELKKYAVSVLT